MTYPRIYSDNYNAYTDFMFNYFGGFALGTMAQGAKYNVTVDPTIIFTDGAGYNAQEIDRLEGSDVGHNGIMRMFETYGIIDDYDNPFEILENGNGNSKLPKWLQELIPDVPVLQGAGIGGLNPFSDEDNTDIDFDLPDWLIIVLIILLLFISYTAYKIYLK